MVVEYFKNRTISNLTRMPKLQMDESVPYLPAIDLLVVDMVQANTDQHHFRIVGQ